MQRNVIIQTEKSHKYEQRDKTNPWWKWGGMKGDLEVSVFDTFDHTFLRVSKQVVVSLIGFHHFHILKITFSASVPSSAPCEQIYFDISRTSSSRSCFKVVVQRVLPRLWYSGLCSDWYLWCVIKGVVLKL